MHGIDAATKKEDKERLAWIDGTACTVLEPVFK